MIEVMIDIISSVIFHTVIVATQQDPTHQNIVLHQKAIISQRISGLYFFFVRVFIESSHRLNDQSKKG